MGYAQCVLFGHPIHPVIVMRFLGKNVTMIFQQLWRDHRKLLAQGLQAKAIALASASQMKR